MGSPLSPTGSHINVIDFACRRCGPSRGLEESVLALLCTCGRLQTPVSETGSGDGAIFLPLWQVYGFTKVSEF